MRGHTSSYVKQFGFYDNFPRPGIFKENLLTGVTENADVSKILMSHKLFWSENKVEQLFYLLTPFHCHWTIFEGFRGVDNFAHPQPEQGGQNTPTRIGLTFRPFFNVRPLATWLLKKSVYEAPFANQYTQKKSCFINLFSR